MAKKAIAKRAAVKKVPKKAARKAPPPAKKPAQRKPAPPSAKRSSPAPAGAGRIVVENVNVPGYRTSVDAAKYEAMRGTLMGVLPRGPPGLTQAEMMDAARPKAPSDHFPGGAKVEWWVKSVQLDQEAKGNVKRSDTKPIRWWRT